MAATWLELARDSRNAANNLLAQDQFRSCVSRANYAAYAKATHELVFTAQLAMPPDREGPSHSRLRPIIETSMPNMRLDKRRKLSELIGRLYTLRIDADYKPSLNIAGWEARQAVSMMTTVFESF